MGTNAGDPIVVDDFIGAIDTNAADIATLEGQVAALFAFAADVQDIMQRGSVPGTPDGNGDIAITFAYSAAPIVVASPGDDAGGLCFVKVVGSTLTNTGCNLRCYDKDEVPITTGTVRVNWHAMGTP